MRTTRRLLGSTTRRLPAMSTSPPRAPVMDSIKHQALVSRLRVGFLQHRAHGRQRPLLQTTGQDMIERIINGGLAEEVQ